jgi:hypothetical protein
VDSLAYSMKYRVVFHLSFSGDSALSLHGAHGLFSSAALQTYREPGHLIRACAISHVRSEGFNAWYTLYCTLHPFGKYTPGI